MPLSLANSAQYVSDRRLAIALARSIDELPQPDTALIGEGQPDGSITYREVATPKVEFAPAVEQLPSSTDATAQSVTAVRLALQDLLEISRELTPEEVRRVNGRLRDEGLETLSQAQLRVWKTIPKALRRGRVVNESEYHLLVERLNDVDDTTLTADERKQLSAMIDEYERRAVGG